MTVPKKFRRNSTIPQILILHRANLHENDTQEIHGVRVTRALRTITDLVHSGHVDRNQLKEAVNSALRWGLITKKEIDLTPDDKLRHSLRQLAGEPA